MILDEDATPGEAVAGLKTKPAASPPSAEMRELTTAHELKALTHPVRIALIEALGFHGPLTATEAGELIGETPTTCSFHLRQLAKYGFVEEAGGGPGRRRPWRLAQLGLRFTSTGADAETRLAATALEALMVDRWIGRYRHWEQTRGAYDREWQDAAELLETVAYVTPAELTALLEALEPLLSKYKTRAINESERPEGALPVEMVLFSYPLQVASGSKPRSETETERKTR